MSVGPILPPPVRGAGRDGESPQDEPLSTFQALEKRRSVLPMSGREAIIASLLLHAIILIVALLAPPGTFVGSGNEPSSLVSLWQKPQERIPMAFVEDTPRPPEPNPDAPAASDRDRRRAQEETPKDPAMAGPYSRGNSPAKFAEGALGGRQKPSAAAPSAPSATPPSPSQPDPTPPAKADRDGAGRRPESFDPRTLHGNLPVPSNGQGGNSEDDKGDRLRQALARMGAGGSVDANGGAPYKFDNPTAGLSTPTGSLSFDTKGFDWGDYSRRIYWIIWSNWHDRMPPAIQTGLKGSVTVHFVIEKDGTLTGIQILTESGVPAYDSAAVLALEASNPLPPLPKNFPDDKEGVTGRFLYNMYR